MALLSFLKNKKRVQEKGPPKPRHKVGAKVKANEASKPKKEAAGPVVLRESRTAWRVLRAPHVTEKSSDLTRFGHYAFKVVGNPSKPEIKKAVEEVYGVHVEKVRKVSLPGKQRKRGKHFGWRSGYKKAIVVLREGEKIEVLPH